MDVQTLKVNMMREDVIILSKDEQRIWFDDCINRVMGDTRFYLDNLEYLPSFKVNWINYGKKRRHRPKHL